VKRDYTSNDLTQLDVATKFPQTQSKDRFSRPSPNLARRLAQQAATDAKRARIYDDQDRITESERQEIMRRKAERYDKLRKGEEAPSAESAIDVSLKGLGLFVSTAEVVERLIEIYRVAPVRPEAGRGRRV